MQKVLKYLVVEKKSTTFAFDLLVALQFLVLSVVVRIRLGQLFKNNPSGRYGLEGCFFLCLLTHFFMRCLLFSFLSSFLVV